MTSIRKKIWVTFQREGTHCYPGAKTDPRLKDVSFLAFPHRHIFHFKVSIEVEHNERDLEFILFKRELESLYSTGENNTLDLNDKSCETIAEELSNYLSVNWSGRDHSVEVSEDGENGAVIDVRYPKYV